MALFKTAIFCILSSTSLLLGFSNIAWAQLEQQIATGVCQATNETEAEFFGGSYILASNMNPGREYTCPINGAIAAAEKISHVVVYINNTNNFEDASVELCYTNFLSSWPDETCGTPSFTKPGAGGTEAITALPPKIVSENAINAFIKIWIPAPSNGYSFLRGFQVY